MCVHVFMCSYMCKAQMNRPVKPFRSSHNLHIKLLKASKLIIPISQHSTAKTEFSIIASHKNCSIVGAGQHWYTGPNLYCIFSALVFSRIFHRHGSPGGGAIKNGQLEEECVTPTEAHSPV